MRNRKDYLGNEILVGDTLYVALLSGRSATMETRTVTGFLPDNRIQVHNPDFRYGTGKGILNFADKTIVDLTKRATP